ncbi:MAG: hypothetical protein HYR63_00125 [Proteobacteria bacterium]|nr:hypothetical protein [Pseudomonadota bacterium]
MVDRRRFIVAGVSIIALMSGLGQRAWAATSRLALDNLYKNPDMPGVDYRPKVLELAGQRVTVKGYVVPHTADSAAPFMVVSAEPLVGCPHCLAALDLPPDSLIAYFKEPPKLADIGFPVTVEGTLELGSRSDAKTGFVSTARLVEARVASF